MFQGSCLVLMLVLAGWAAEARGEEVQATLSAGAIRLDKRTPVELSTTSTLVRVEGGRRLGTHTAARVRVEGFRADGLNLLVSLVGEIELTRHVGAQGWAGLSAGGRSGVGNTTGAGLFGRWFPVPDLALRVDGFVSLAMRNDFAGHGIGLVLGVEWRPWR